GAKKCKLQAGGSSPFLSCRAIRRPRFCGKSGKGRARHARNPDHPRMILPAVRERLEALLRHPAMEGALAALRAGGSHVSITGLHDVAKALVAACLTHELRRPAFFVTDSNRRAESLADTLRFFAGIFPGAVGGVATLPAFDRLPWESQSPHADILERRAATLFRLVDGEISLVIAPIAAALWRYQDPAAYLYLARTLAKDKEIPHEELVTHLGSVGYTRTEMVELAESSLRPIVFLDEPETLRQAAAQHLAAATENYERHGHANSSPASHYFWSEEQSAAALGKTSQIHVEQLALAIGSTPQFELSSRPSSRFHGDVVACMGDVKSQLASGGRVFLTAASTGEIERFADIC